VGAPGETWSGINMALYSGGRGLSAGLSVRKLLIKYRGVRPPLTIEQILKWADAEHRRTGHWPKSVPSPVMDAPGEKWNCINWALHVGSRGLPAGLSMRELLIKYRGAPEKRILHSPLTIQQILEWADAEYRRTGRWPNLRSRVHGVPGVR
jgi:hypothetical protein